MGSVVITHYGVCDTNCCTKDFGCLTLLPTVSARLNLSLELCVPPPLALESKKIKRFSPRTEVEPATNVQNKNFYCSYSVIPDLSPSSLYHTCGVIQQKKTLLFVLNRGFNSWIWFGI